MTERERDAYVAALQVAFDAAVERYARWLVTHRWRVVALSLAAVGAMTAGALRLEFSTDFRVYFGPDNPQLVEVTRDKKVVWAFKDFATFGNNLAAAQVLGVEGKVIR